MTTERSRLPGHLWFALLCAAAGLAPWLGGQMTGPEPWAARALAAAAGLAWLADRWGEWRIPRPAVWLWLFAGWGAFTAVFAANRHDSLAALSGLVSWAVLATLASDAAGDPARRKILAGSLLGGLVVVSAFGAWDSLTNVPGWRIFGPFATPNLFAAYLVTLLPLPVFFVMSLPLRSRDGAERSSLVWWLAACAVGGAALAATGSKGAVLALAAALLLALALGFFRHVRSGAWLLAAALAMALAVGGNTLLGRVGAAGGGEAHSAQFRVWTWMATQKMALDNPVVGVGVGNFGSEFNRYALAGWTEAAHNAYLQTAAETGLPGLGLFLTAMASAAFWLFRAGRSGSLWGYAALAGLLAAAAHNLVDYGWVPWGPPAALWVLVGLGLAGEERARRPLPKAAALAMSVPLFLSVLGGILAANAAALAPPRMDAATPVDPARRVEDLRAARRLDPLDGNIARELGVALATAGRPEESIEALRDAVRLAPGEPTAWRFLGEAYRNAGRMDEARTAFEEGLRRAPNAMKLLLEAARLAEATGRPDDAMRYYRRIIGVWGGPVGLYAATPEIVPVEPIAARDALADAAEAAGRMDEARAHSKVVVALADLYETNREKHALIWQATGQDRPESLAAVRAMRDEAARRLHGTGG